ncbi:hypothetical protein J8281_06150 [Aquimarina sp. U1-2]|uniref:hypothetical protein n=1 Tax=Aquimarina sp. U1-2 TaxID=2823141 RepID=UPI001AECFF36|nr:hypothetical protein [Aquimarina sp. U1-2]MBP2831766.1 hypothetical protein [Aquimarina sp. U1-2]
MKKFVFVALTMLLFSCSTEENTPEPINEEVVESSEFKNIDALERLALDLEATAKGKYNIQLSDEKKVKLLEIANQIFSDINDMTSKKALMKRPCSYDNCVQEYENCIWWPENLQRLLRECSGIQSAHCDQVRLDYENNIDEIEATYLRCSRAYSSCVSCPGIIGPL